MVDLTPNFHRQGARLSLDNHVRHLMARPIFKAIVQIISSVIVLGAGLISYAGYAEHTAMRKAIEFCSSIRIGEKADTLLERARASGAHERLTYWIEPRDEDRWLPVTFTGFTPFSRHICSIKATNIVTKFKYVYLD
jgi:hypothetical protein